MRFASYIIVLLLPLQISAQLLPLIDSLREQSRIEKDERQLIQIYNDLVDQWAEANFDSASLYAQKMYSLAKQMNDPVTIGRALRVKGVPFDYHSEYDSARSYYLKALSLGRQSKDSLGITNAMFNLAVMSFFEGDFLNAIEKFREVEQLYKRLGDERHLGRLYNNLGVIYRKTEQYPAAIEAYQNSILIKEKNKDLKGILNTSTNLSSLYINSHDYVNGEKNSRRVIEMAKSLGDSLAYTSELINLGIVLQHLNKKEEGHKYLLEAEKRLAGTDIIRMKTECWANLADYYLNERDFPRTMEYLRKIEPVLYEGTAELTVTYYRLRTNYFAATGNYQMAFESQRQADTAQQKYVTDKLRERTKEYDIRYQSEKKERQITDLELEKQASLLKLAEGTYQRNFLIAIVAGLVFIAALIFVQFMQKRKSNALLTEKNDVIVKALDERETLLREIHHRVKNNLQIISSLLNLQAKNVEDAAAHGAVVESRNRVKSMALIHEQLYAEDTVTGVFMPTYIEHLTDSLAASFGIDREYILIKLDVEPLLLDVDTAIPAGLILNELVTNAFKYAFIENEKGELTISLKKVADILNLTVADTGKGMQTANVRRDSFGMNLINSLAKKLRAEVRMTVVAGTCVELRITDFKVIEMKGLHAKV